MSLLRTLVFELFVRPVLIIFLGLSFQGREKLPKKGPMILVSNHNSHLDTPVLMALFDHRGVSKVRPVAAADYFLKSRISRFFFLNFVKIIPIERCGELNNKSNPLQSITDALVAGDTVVFYPEGTRGNPEEMAPFNKGIARLAEAHPDVPVVPVYINGLGKSLPKGDFLLVPFVCQVIVGDPIRFADITDRQQFLFKIEASVKDLSSQVKIASWT